MRRFKTWHPLVRMAVGAFAGALIAVGIGLIAVALAPTDGFGDLAAAAVTIVFGIPAGVLIGGFAGYWIGRGQNTPDAPTS